MSVLNLGDYNTTETVNLPFNTFDSNDPTQSVIITDLVAADIKIHKDGTLAQRTSANGVTVSINFDGITGNHMIHIVLSDNTDAGFYSDGSRYSVRIEGVTVDTGTLNSWVGFFSVGCTLRPTTVGRTLDILSTGEAAANVTHIMDTILTEGGAGRLSAAFIKLFDVAVPLLVASDVMRGTDLAALASVVGALADAASDGDPTAADTLMQYIKQLINILVGSVGIPAFPAEAAPANDVSLAEVIRAIHTDVTGLNGNVMRGTDGANVTVPDPAGTAATPAEVATALTNIHLDHLFAVNYDPAAKPGVATALLNELIESDAGVSRYTLNALEQGRGTNGANVTVPDPAGTAATPAEVASALTAIHLDHLFAVNYDPAAKPGVATALLNELIEDDGGLSRFTINALEQARGTNSASTATKLLAYIQLLARSDTAINTDNATELTEINTDGGSGAGDFDNQTDAEEAIKDRGDIAWITGAGGDATEAKQNAITALLVLIQGVGFVTGSNSLKAIRDRGDIAWITGGGVGGASTVTFTIQEAGPIPIPDASVQIWNTGLTVLISYGVTDSNGQIQITANDGSYKVKVRKAGFSFSDPFDLTVSGNTSQIYTGTDYAPSAPENPDTCRVYEYINDATGSPVGVIPDNLVNIMELPYDDGSIIYSGETITGTYDSETGLIYWDIVKGSTAHFSLSDFNIDLKRTVPTSDTIRLSDMVE